MANRYWVNELGDYDANNAQNWSTIAGGLGGAGFTAADVLNFTGDVTDLCIFSAHVTCAGFDAQSGYTGSLRPNGKDLTVSGDLSIAAGAQVKGISLNGSTITVAGNATLTGQAGSLLDLEADAAWTFNVTGTATVTYANVAYSDASGGSEITTHFCIDKGNNTNWGFAAGSISLAQEYLRLSLAACATFQAWTGSADSDEALTKIYHEGLPAPGSNADAYTLAELEGYRPYAMVYTAEDQGIGLTRVAIGTSGYEFRAAGNLRLQLVENVSDSLGDEPTSLANRDFKNTVGKIMDELCTLAGQAGYLAFERMAIEYGPYWPRAEEVPAQGLYQAVKLAIQWGAMR